MTASSKQATGFLLLLLVFASGAPASTAVVGGKEGNGVVVVFFVSRSIGGCRVCGNSIFRGALNALIPFISFNGCFDRAR